MASRLNPFIQKFLRLFFTNLYSRLAFMYDAVAWLSSMGQWRLWRDTARITFNPGLILELGHGPGHLLLELSQDGRAVIGLDPSIQMNHLTRRRFKRNGLMASLVRARAQDLPFCDLAFTSIVCTFPSEYIVDPDTLRSAHRVLAHKGWFIMVGMIEITGPSLPDRFAHWLYTITGQSGPIPPGWDDFLRTHGFEPRIEKVILKRSIVTRIVATRVG